MRTALDVPFTVAADCDLGTGAAPWLADQNADVTIERAPVPDALPDADAGGLAWQCAGERLLITLPCGIRFLVAGGETIRYAVEDGVGAADLRLFLLGTAWPALAMQRGLLPLHASAIAEGACVHAFLGHSAAGKSTLAAALTKRGHPFFADDVLLLDPNVGAEALCYRYEDLKLWPKALVLVGVADSGPVREVADFDKRYAVPPCRSPRVNGRLRTLRVLGASHQPGNPLRDTPLRGKQAFQAVYAALHRRPFAVAIIGRARIFERLAQLLRTVDVFAFDRAMAPARFEADVAALSGLLAESPQPGSARGNPSPVESP